MAANAKCSLVRIMGGDTRVPLGGGVFLGNRQVLTCARVVASALGSEPGPAPPAGSVRVDFPHLTMTGAPLRARVADFGWFSPADMTAGIAVLNIESDPPPDARPPEFRDCDDSYRGHVDVFGHPNDLPGGVWSEARLSGPVENDSLVQLDFVPDGYPIQLGFEGAGVIDQATGAVIGWVARVAHAESGVRMAWMMPLKTVLRHMPEYGFIRTEPALAVASPARAALVRIPRPSVTPEQRAMIDALRALVDVPSGPAADELAGDLSTRLGRFFVAQPGPAGIVDPAGLALACIAFPGGMHELIDELHRRYGEPGPAALSELDRLVPLNIPAPLLTPQDRKALYELLADTSLPRARYAYRQAAHPLGKPLPADADNVIAIAGALEEHDALPGGLPPLLAFVESLAREASPAKAQQLGRWTADYGRRERIDGRLILPYSTGYAAVGPSGSAPAYLVVRLDAERRERIPPRTDQARFSVTAWLQRESGFGDTLRRDADTDTEPRPLRHLRASLMDELLTQAQEKLAALATVPIVEFILPRDLLWSGDVDQWPAGRENPGKKLGEVYPVVVRSLERMSDSDIRPRWERKWAWAKANCGRYHWQACMWLPEEGQQPSEDEFMRNLSGGPPVCLALGYAPSAPHGLSRDEISVGLKAGLPIMVWCRNGGHPAIEATLGPLVHRHPLLQLPQLVAERRAGPRRGREARRGAVNSAAGDGGQARHLTLLFDPADRFPEPDVTSRAPQ